MTIRQAEAIARNPWGAVRELRYEAFVWAHHKMFDRRTSPNIRKRAALVVRQIWEGGSV